MYIWTEITASRGSREIASCLYTFIHEHISVDEPIETLRAWSDSCGGQNRNFIVTYLFLHILDEYPKIKSIVHKFPISGHSFLPNDRDFGDVEKAKKKKDAIYTVNQYETVMKSSKKQTPEI